MSIVLATRAITRFLNEKEGCAHERILYKIQN